MSKTYILQKDLPDVKAGAKLTINERGDLYFLKSDNGSIPYISELVENNPSWFLPEPQITNIIFSNGIEITTPDQSFVPNSVKVNGITFDLKLDEENKKYTEQDMRNCFRFSNQLPRELYLSKSFEFYFQECMEIINKERNRIKQNPKLPPHK